MPWKVGILCHWFASQQFESHQMSSLVLQRPVKVKKERSPLGVGRAQDTLLLPSTCPTGQSLVLLHGSFQVSSNGMCLSFTSTSTAPFRNFGRAENYQQLSHLACSPTAKQCVFCWSAENLQVSPASFRYVIVIWKTKVRKFRCFEFIISHVRTDM